MARTRDLSDDGDYDRTYDRTWNLQLKDHVKYAKLSVGQIADELGWSTKKVQRILDGDTRLLVCHLPEFSRVLRKPVADLLTPPPGTRQRRAA